MPNERQEQQLERLQEDERLRGDLEDDAATALLNWASDKVRAATNDPQRADVEVESDIQLIRTSARTAARSGASDPQQVLAQAEGAWTLARTQSAPLAQQAPSSDSVPTAPQTTLVAAPLQTPATQPAIDVAPPAQGAATTLTAAAEPTPAAQPPHRKHHPSHQWLRKLRSWARRVGDSL